jgi:hypothetical protein
VGIVGMADLLEFYHIKQAHFMRTRNLINESKWMLLALVITFFLVSSIYGSAILINSDFSVSNTFLGLNLFLEILVFFTFSTFVVFGIKGFFEMYSQRFTNVILLLSGVFLAAVVFILSYQILLMN